MFKEGDKVVCISDSTKLGFIDSQEVLKLKLYETYNIVYLCNNEIGLYETMGFLYNRKRFKLLSEIRKEKLNKLCSK